MLKLFRRSKKLDLPEIILYILTSNPKQHFSNIRYWDNIRKICWVGIESISDPNLGNCKKFLIPDFYIVSISQFNIKSVSISDIRFSYWINISVKYWNSINLFGILMLFQYLTLILIQYENLISEIDTDLILNCDIETI